MLNRSYLILVLGLALSACGGGGGGGNKPNNSVDENGNCKQGLLDDYNEVVYAKDKASAAYNANASTYELDLRLKDLDKKCTNFYANHGGVTCNAVDQQTKASIKVPADNFASVCKAAKDYVSGASKSQVSATPAPLPTQAPVNTESTRLDYYFDQELKFAVLDPVKTKALALDSALTVYGGKIGTREEAALEAVKTGTPICFLTSVSSLARDQMVSGQAALTVSTRDESVSASTGNRELRVLFNNGDLSLTCIRFDSQKFTVKDLKTTLKGILDFSVPN
jgi:hypothetical protein